ncbi:MAG: GTP 3',8-cyclase MoaA [Candidatus Neomarinimicrobiota bacterium]|nr:MAG: GTP 3',8-cyclase MoaA [Candidatus Neomarinimicrobiota bacterium]
MVDPFGRSLTYLRLAVTDRCNLRCAYCLPPQGSGSVSRASRLSWEELITLSRIFLSLGVNKIRITGGEPFVRKGLLDFLGQLRQASPRLTLGITTNGTALGPHLPRLQELGIRHLNISLDTLNASRYRAITGRSLFPVVWNNILAAEKLGFRLKINLVVLEGVNDDEIPAFVHLTRDHDWTVRFIEPMPFDSRGGTTYAPLRAADILDRIRAAANVEALPPHQAVDQPFQVPGYRGRLGLIAGYSRTFCSTCSRLRLNSRGQLRTCLYGPPAADLNLALRSGASAGQIRTLIRRAVAGRHADGFQAEASRSHRRLDSMAAIGG